MSTELRPRSRLLRWIFIAWLLALPVGVAIMYVAAATAATENDRLYGTGGALFIGGALALPWVIGLLVLGWIAFRRPRA
jgi:lipopolysaccharide export LptBFGC system permease protein LptF